MPSLANPNEVYLLKYEEVNTHVCYEEGRKITSLQPSETIVLIP